MAIKQKVPSPQEIKKTPTKFSNTEMEEIRTLQKNISDITFQFGQINISKMKITEREEFLKKELSNLETQEAKIAEKLSNKYGKGNLNLDTGEFIPVE